MAAMASAAKTLEAWRSGVSYGEFLQPIRLTVQRPTPPPPAVAPVSPSAAPEPAADADANGELQDKVASEAPSDTVLVIPALESAEITGAEHRVALNVGGPVWAMDWLPRRAIDRSEDDKSVAEAPAKKHKPKRGRPPTRGKDKCEGLGKENTAENAATSDAAVAVAVAAAGSEEPGKQGDDPLEWRFLALSTHPPCEVQDGQVVRPTPPDHYYDVQEGAPGLIQIWAVPVPSRAGVKRALPTPTPRLVYGIEHSSGVAWEMQWSPLVAHMPDEIQARNLLGVLAVTFGDGSLRVFAVPQIPPERLQAPGGSSDGAFTCIEALPPLVTALLPRIIPLCLQWSPRCWNLLLTGGSDGSIALWNIEPSLLAAGGTEGGDADPMEPQRRFQDADTIGKQDAFDWGNGWAAVRAISWSPFDDFIFASTGNDSLFKIWDVREPRICLRSHRIRSTWGNAIQWINDTSIQISGDQGSIFHYDIVSGSYQKLHFHPQVDSPIWDIQLGRRNPIPILLSACASGSIRVAPARKLYRAPHNCVEFCHIAGRKSATIHDEFKELTVSFELSTILGSSEGMGPGIREFCERDAALHRLRITSARPHEFPCLLACAGHAGLVLILEMQEMLDNLIADHFQPPSKKKTGRPKKIRFPLAGTSPSVAPAKSVPASVQPPGRRHVTLGSFVTVKAGGSSAKKQKQKKKKKTQKQKVMMATVKYDFERGSGPGVEDPDGEEEEEEEEFDDAEESESDVSPDLDDDENSDDDRAIFSDNDMDEDAGTTLQQLNPSEVRLMTEYQLDLSEEDAILLAIQMSEVDQSHAGDSLAVASTVDSDERTQMSITQNGEVETVTAASSLATKSKKKAPAKRKAPAKTPVKKTKASSPVVPPPVASLPEQVQAGEAAPTTVTKGGAVAAVVNVKTELSAGAAMKKKKLAPKKPSKKAKATLSKKAASGLATEHEQMVDQATALHMITYQRGMTEEEALMEAIRQSEMESKRRSSRPKRPIAQVEVGEHGVAGSAAMQSPSRRRKVEPPQSNRSLEAETSVNQGPAVDETKEAPSAAERTAESVTTSPPEASVQEASTLGVTGAAASVSTAESPLPVFTAESPLPVSTAEAPPPPAPPSPTSAAAKEKPKKPSLKQRKPAAQSRKKKAQSSGTSKPRALTDLAKVKAKEGKAKEGKAKEGKAKEGKAKEGKAKKVKGKAPASGRRGRSDSLLQGVGGEVLSEHEALLMALKTSEIEY